MPFGLTNAPPDFQQLMNNLLQPVIYKFALVCLDDVIIYMRTIEEHIKDLQAIFDLIRKGGLKVKL